MKGISPILLAALLFIASSMAGCSGGATLTASPTLLQTEYATYRILASGHVVGHVEQTLLIKDGEFSVTGKVGIQDTNDIGSNNPVKASNSSFEATGETATGRITHIHTQSYDDFLFGANAQMPSPNEAIAQNFGPDLARSLTPLGPQWILLANGADQDSQWGEIRIHAWSSRTAWHAIATSECQTNCWFTNLTKQELRTSLEGDNSGGVFPTKAVLEVMGFTGNVTLIRDRHELPSRPALAIHFEPPASAALLDSRPCEAILPCETAQWPYRLSIIAGYQALRQSTEWMQFTATYPDHFPTSFVTFTGLNVSGTVNKIEWFSSFGSPAMDYGFRLEGFTVAEKPVGPARVDQSGPHTPQIDERVQIPSTMATTDALARVMAQLGVNTGAGQSLSIYYRPHAMFPDPRGASFWGFQISDGRYAYVSLNTGNLLRIDHGYTVTL